MASRDITATVKKIKNEKNSNVRSEDTPLGNKQQSSENRLRELFQHADAMNKLSKTKKREIEGQLKDVQGRLDENAGYLTQLKSSIDSIKFSYEQNIVDLEKVTKESRNDMDKQIEEIRTHISNLHAKAAQQEKAKLDKHEVSTFPQEKAKPQTYQEALNEVLNAFQSIAQGPFRGSNRN